MTAPEVIAGPFPLSPKPWRVLGPDPDCNDPCWRVVAYFATRPEAEAWLDARRRRYREACLRERLRPLLWFEREEAA